MGILKNGPWGKFRGRVGNTVSYTLMGKEVIRMIGENHKPPSVKQLANRQGMGVVIHFIAKIKGFIDAGFCLVAKEANKYPHNMALSFNKKHALQGIYPDIAMDYTKVLVAQGSLQPAQNPRAELVPEGLRFSWDAEPGMDWQERKQSVMLLAYFPESEKVMYTVNGAKRIAGNDILPLGPKLAGEYMETYISFITTPANQVADSVYTGRVN